LRIGARLLLSVIVPALTVIGLLVLGVISAQNARRDALVTLRERNEQALEVVALTAAVALAENDAARLDGLVDQLAAQGRVHGMLEVAVLDHEGRIAAHADPTRFGERATDPFALAALTRAVPSSALDGSEMRVAVPAVSGLRWGTVVARWDVSPVQQAVAARWWRMVGFAVGISVIGALLLAAALGRAVVSPLSELRRVVAAVERGDFSTRARPRGARELQELGEGVNRMVAALAQQRVELERVVAERTAELLAANVRLERLAVEDGLTGLANHRRFREALRDELLRAARQGRPVALLMVDVDHFKRFNDTLGHPAGDAMLREVAEALRGSVRVTDLCARYGGEEFAVLMPETSLEAADVVAERVRAAVERVGAPREARPAVTVSVGVAACHAPLPDDPAGDGLVDAADRALYRAKHGGRNCVRTDGTLLARAPSAPLTGRHSDEGGA
jgi:diguanylate cyclase (GGDEF)-like protein